MLEQVREGEYTIVDEHLTALAQDNGGPERERHARALVECAQPLAPLVFRRVGDAGPKLRAELLEAMTKRYYRVRELDRLEHRSVDGVPLLLSSFEHAGVGHRAAAAFAEPGDLSSVLSALGSFADSVDDSEAVIADVYAWRADPHDDADEDALAARLGELIAAATLPATLTRVTFVVAMPEGGKAERGTELITFRREGEDTLVEDRGIRGLHPMIAERLDLWRLSNFELERLPADQDVHLFRARAHANARDERLVAVAEVRDA